MMMKALLKSAVVLVVVLIGGLGERLWAQPASTDAGCAAEKYQLVALPLQPSQVNDTGLVVGTAAHRAAIWTSKSGLTQIDLPPGFHHAEGVAVNNRGEVLATASTADGSQRQSFVYAKGNSKLLSGGQAKGRAINQTGEIAGESTLPGKAGIAPVIWKKDKVEALGGAAGGTATGLNDRGHVIGQTYDQAGRYQAFVWDATHGLQLIGPEEGYSSAIAINDAGHVLVQGFTQGVFLFRDGQSAPLKLSPQWPSQPRGLSACDVVVGSFGSNSDESRAFIWDAKHGFRDLNELVVKENGTKDNSWTLEAASSINRRGEIVGWGDHGGEDDAGFLLVPVKK